MAETIIATKPRVTGLKVILSHDPDMNVDEYVTRFHWERFGQDVDVDPDETYHSPHGDGYRTRPFDFDDEAHPIYTLQKGAKLVIDESARYKTGEASAREMLVWLADDAKLVRRWKQDQWYYVVVEVEATITTEVDGRAFTDTQSEYLGGVDDGANENPKENREYLAGVIQELVGELKASVTKDGRVEWPDSLAVPEPVYE